jgi:hypothetical protein
MADEIKSSGAFSLQMVPILESGANWSDFEWRIQEWLVMSGLGSTLDVKNKPVAPVPIQTPSSSQTGGVVASESNAAQTGGNAAFITQQVAFKQRLTTWEKKQSRGCMAIRNRCGYNQFVKV